MQPILTEKRFVQEAETVAALPAPPPEKEARLKALARAWTQQWIECRMQQELHE